MEKITLMEVVFLYIFPVFFSHIFMVINLYSTYKKRELITEFL